MITRTLCPALWWLAESLTLRQPEHGQRHRWAGALAALAHFSSPEGTFHFCSAQSPGSGTLLVVLDLSLPQLRDTLGAQRHQCPTIQAEKLREKGYVVPGMSWGPSQGRHNCAHQPLGRRCCQEISTRNESLGSTGISSAGWHVSNVDVGPCAEEMGQDVLGGRGEGSRVGGSGMEQPSEGIHRRRLLWSWEVGTCLASLMEMWYHSSSGDSISGCAEDFGL